jgi:hypothetical protein
MVLKIVNHGRFVQRLVAKRGWGCGARYTNLRDVREQNIVAMIDVDWRRYSYKHHLAAVQAIRPFMTVVRDIESEKEFNKALRAADKFLDWVEYVIIVPKFSKWSRAHERQLSNRHIVGFSLPTRYGSTTLSISQIEHQIHLLGGRPDRQRHMAANANVVSIDCNRFTLDAAYGDYFDGLKYNYSRQLDYELCLLNSMLGIEQAWSDYALSPDGRVLAKRWKRFMEKRQKLRPVATADVAIRTVP